MQQIAIKLPFKVSANEIYAGTHWNKRKKHKDIMLWSLLGIKSKLKPVETCELSFEFSFKRNPLDNSNCFYLIKLIEDCLTHYKIIKDDNYKIVQKITVTSNKGVDDEVRITITEKE